MNESISRMCGAGFALLVASCLVAPMAGQAGGVVTDPPRDAKHPMRNEAVWIPSGGVPMNGVMYAAAGIQPHPTALLLHGLPGNEQGLDVAQSLRRAGYNVLTFHYRGSWGSPGKFTLAGGVEDGQAALAFLHDPVNVEKFHIDLARVLVVGHSYGGFIASRVAAAHAKIAGVVLMAPWNPGETVAAFRVPEAKFAAAAHSVFDDSEGRLGGYRDIDMAKELVTPGNDWHLESSAAAVKNLPLLILVAEHDSADDQAAALIAALKKLQAPKVATVTMDTDHSFCDHRIALQNAILDWLHRSGL